MDLYNDIPKYRKKSKGNGVPRSNHKHQYKTVLLKHVLDNPFKAAEKIERYCPYEVCTICGRIGNINLSYCKQPSGVFLFGFAKEDIDKISDVKSLELWVTDESIPKYARKMEEDIFV